MAYGKDLQVFYINLQIIRIGVKKMKIIVATELEKTLIEKFIDQVNLGEQLDQLEDVENDGLDSVEITIIENGFLEAKVELGKTDEMSIDDSHLFGTCTTCGAHTEGTIDGDDITYDDWIAYNLKESLATWECESCINK